MYFAANFYKMLARKIDELGKQTFYCARVSSYRTFDKSSCIPSDYSDILSFSFIFCKNHW